MGETREKFSETASCKLNRIRFVYKYICLFKLIFVFLEYKCHRVTEKFRNHVGFIIIIILISLINAGLLEWTGSVRPTR